MATCNQCNKRTGNIELELFEGICARCNMKELDIKINLGNGIGQIIQVRLA